MVPTGVSRYSASRGGKGPWTDRGASTNTPTAWGPNAVLGPLAAHTPRTGSGVAGGRGAFLVGQWDGFLAGMGVGVLIGAILMIVWFFVGYGP